MAIKFTKTEREGVKTRVALLDRMGWNQHDIARDVGVSQPMVCEYLKQVRAEYVRRRVEGRQDRVNEMVATLADLRAVAYRALLKSEGEARRRTVERLTSLTGEPKVDDAKTAGKRGKKGSAQSAATNLDGAAKPTKAKNPNGTVRGYQKEIEQVEERLARGEYMQVILATLQAERDLLGLDAPRQTENRNLNFNIDWDAIAGTVDAALARPAPRDVTDVTDPDGPAGPGKKVRALPPPRPDPVADRLAEEARKTREHHARKARQSPDPDRIPDPENPENPGNHKPHGPGGNGRNGDNRGG